jgi:F1F0 ATPase subunit 2
MTTNEIWPLAAAAALGLILGGAYFGALWWTIGRLPGTSRPTFWLAGSFIVRISLAMGAFYLLLLQGVSALAAALVGFLLARFLWLRLKSPGKKPKPLRQGTVKEL